MSVINTNIASLTAQKNLGMNQASLATAMQRLSSGLRINSAKDDAAGLAISERMTAQIRGSDQAARNANDGISLAQTAEGDLAQIGNNLQRMRELAVQSSNATNSSSDRAALDGEVQALSAEIDRVSSNSSFNGVKLLDGSFSAQRFQVGANNTANDAITIASIASARTSQLGGVGTSSAATTTSGATKAALVAGDLTLNGFQVGASQLGSAPGQSTASATSIAAAINTISSSSGVTATANSNTVTGGTITAFVAGAGTGHIAADTFSINGVNVGEVQGGATAAGQGANVAAAINAIATQTGVTATAAATDGTLTLRAADGRDISIGLNGTATGATAGAQTTAAAQAKSNLEAQTGLQPGVVGTQATAGLAVSAPVAATTGNLGAYTAPGLFSGTGTHTVEIVLSGSGIPTVTAWDMVVATQTQSVATMAAELSVVGFTADGKISSGYTISYGGEGNASAALTAGTLSFSRADGANFSVVLTEYGIPSAATASFANGNSVTTVDGNAGAAVAVVDAVAAANHGTVTLKSTSADGIVWAGASAAKAGLAASGTATATTTSSVSSIASMNVLTAADATSALAAIDGALSTVNSSRAALGAIQNRFTSVVTSLQTTSENLSASRSRIQDADFASETANLSRAQILQQAGTAMVAQANQLPQGVLALLR